MSHTAFSRSCLLPFIFLICLSLPLSARADDAQEFDRLVERAHQQYNENRYADMEKTALELCRLAEGPLKGDREKLPEALFQLAHAYERQGQYAKSLETYRRTLQLDEMIYGAESEAVANVLNNLGLEYRDLCRYGESEQCHKRALKIRENLFGAEHEHIAKSLSNLASLAFAQGRYQEAEDLYKRTLAMREKLFGPRDWQVATDFQELGQLYACQGRYPEAEAARKRGVELLEKDIADKGERKWQLFVLSEQLVNLGIMYEEQNRFAEAAPLMERALRIQEGILREGHPSIGHTLSSLGRLYMMQRRWGLAEHYLKKGLELQEKALGPKHPAVAVRLGSLGDYYLQVEDWTSAEPVLRRTLAIQEESLGKEHREVLKTLPKLGIALTHLHRYAEAEPLFLRALQIGKKILPSDDIEIAIALQCQGLLYQEMKRYDDAIIAFNRAIEIYRSVNQGPLRLCLCYRSCAEVRWQMKRPDAAIADLKKSMELTNRYRAMITGGDATRSRALAEMSRPFELMVAWQAERGDLSAALAAVEQARGRTFLDQMEAQGRDLLDDVQDREAQSLRQRQNDARARVTVLEARLQSLARRQDLAAAERAREEKKLKNDLDDARFDCFDVIQDIQDASPAYRLIVGKNRRPVSLGGLEQMARSQNELILEYFLGEDAGWLLVVRPGTTRIENLAVGKDAAKTLGVDAGPLTYKRCEEICGSEKSPGVVECLRGSEDPEKLKEAVNRLAVLWEVLIPEQERRAILDGKYRRLIVLPDGPMAKLPFETLVVEKGDHPQYILDVGPPIEYAPSATILKNLAGRAGQGGLKDPEGRQPVLIVGDCRYGAKKNSNQEDVLVQLTPRVRYGTLGGRLEPLPNSATEIQWVAKVFGEKEIKVAWLKGDLATEAAVRFNAPGRRLLHFACHGLVDERYSNLFGALALTPGPNTENPADDGFLTLAEIYEMNLKGCELAILSACDTNVGPQQRGEGIWALSRGFLVAGARRVVASNWLVDDEAAPNFVSYFTSILAKAEKEGKTPDYAQALHDAKLFLRHHKNKIWRNPYYWGTFVLIGPH